MSSEPNERWQKQRWGREQISLRPDWNFKNSAHNFNRVPIFEPGEWQPLSHQNQRVSRSCFMTPGMLAYPLAYIIPPAALWGGGGGSTANRGGGRGRWSTGRQVVKFPLAGPVSSPIWLAFSWAEVWQPIRPPGRLRSCQLRQQPLSHVCLLTDREATEASKKPQLLSTNEAAAHAKKTQGRDGEELESKQCWLMLKVKRWPAILPTSIHLVHERPCNFRVMGFPMPHCVSITKPHKLCGFSAPSAYWSHARKYFPGQRDHFVDSCCRWGRRDSLRTFNERPPAVPLVEHANRSHLLQIKVIKNSERLLSVGEVCVFCANIVRQFSLFC